MKHVNNSHLSDSNFPTQPPLPLFPASASCLSRLGSCSRPSQDLINTLRGSS